MKRLGRKSSPGRDHISVCVVCFPCCAGAAAPFCYTAMFGDQGCVLQSLEPVQPVPNCCVPGLILPLFANVQGPRRVCFCIKDDRSFKSSIPSTHFYPHGLKLLCKFISRVAATAAVSTKCFHQDNGTNMEEPTAKEISQEIPKGCRSLRIPLDALNHVPNGLAVHQAQPILTKHRR